MVVLLDDDADSNNEGVVMVAAEHCDANHVNFMARQARGLVCLTLTWRHLPRDEGNRLERARALGEPVTGAT